MRFRIHYPNASILAVEAGKQNFEILKKNTTADSFTKAIYGALWHEDTTLVFNMAESGNPESGSASAESTSGERISAFSIPTLMKTMGWKTIDILKLDIEGAEHALFSGDTSWLEYVNSIVMEVPDADHPGTLQLIFKKLAVAQWNASTCGECLILIREGIDWKPQRVWGVYSQNT